MIYSKELDFSFSGLKTALLYTVKKIGELTPEIKKGLALEFENAIVEVLSAKTKKALEKYPVKSLIVGGGVIANKTVRNAMSKVAEEFGVEFRLPTQTLSTDNAIMIAIVGAINFHSGKRAHPDLIKANGNLVLS
jgi:N6-L-threonylcarbamoyladenine synthase